jgi:hypothetical protein
MSCFCPLCSILCRFEVKYVLLLSLSLSLSLSLCFALPPILLTVCPTPRRAWILRLDGSGRSLISGSRPTAERKRSVSVSNVDVRFCARPRQKKDAVTHKRCKKSGGETVFSCATFFLKHGTNISEISLILGPNTYAVRDENCAMIENIPAIWSHDHPHTS